MIINGCFSANAHFPQLMVATSGTVKFGSKKEKKKEKESKKQRSMPKRERTIGVSPDI